ncbi:hypothetical protein [Polyangium sorediatum]|uniref:Molecular chaperone DnaK n=1 Tax=Polyangium sorediatum TaxID=889274 RepID=A0ABT6P412_9BACT|nr:hypothetical protein [Polyangium sorediatum]MDI1435345.1 hypothetical protein [Polyangium sorediatum]
MNDTATQTPAPERATPSPRVRIDVISTVVQRALPNGVRMEIRPPRPVTAAWDQALPLFEGWMQSAELRVRVSGLTDSPFFAALEIEGAKAGTAVAASIGSTPAEAGAGPLSPFSVEFVVPLALLAPHAGKRCALRLILSPQSSLAGGRKVTLARALFVGIPGYGPLLSALDLLESTDSVLVDAPERRLFDLQNPEEGLWIGTGKWRLRLFADWGFGGEARLARAEPPSAGQTKLEGEPFVIDTKPSHVLHRFQRDDDAPAVVVEDATRRAGGRRTYTELVLDSSHPDLLPIPEEGKDVPLDLTVEHALTYGEHTGVCTWHAALPVRLRDPRPLLKSFQRLSAVGIDFGTTATVAALYQKGYRSLLRLGSGSAPASKSAENPTYLLVEDHERLWAEVERAAAGDARFPNLLRVVRGSHAAREAMTDSPNAVVGELKSLPERVLSLDQSPQLRDRERRRDFLLDENRVRILVRAYAYLLSRAINRPGQDVYLRYWLTHPAKFDERARKLLEEEIRRGILLGIPEGIPAEEIVVEMSASEPEAFAAEVCPELATYAELEPVISKFGEMRFAVFDFGGGTLDIACGRFRPATEQEAEELGSRTVIETLQVSGDDHLGGDYLTHELVWLTHQHDKHLPEMEDKEVPMMRPQTVPPNNLANKPHLYKRSLAGRQNRFRFERELGLEAVKFAPENEPRSAADLSAARLDGSEVRLESMATDVPALHAKLKEHLQTRIRDGVKLMKSMLAIAPWGTEGDWREQGVTILLAGNSSRSAFVEQALADELGIPGLKVWRPGSSDPFQQVVLYETPQRTERGVTIVGVTPKTAVALGALKIANREVHLVRRAQGFSYFVGDLRGFPPKFVALVQMGTPVSDPAVFGPHYVDFGKWDTKTPLRVAQEYAPGKMTSNDPRVSMIPTGLAAGIVGRLFVCVSGPDELTLALQRDGQDPLVTTLNLAKYMR